MVRIPATVKAFADGIRRNPLQKQIITSREKNLSSRTMSRTIKEALGFRFYRRTIGQLLIATLWNISSMITKPFDHQQGN